MCHLNIRSLPEDFIEFTAYIVHLNIDFKIIALSETWLNHITLTTLYLRIHRRHTKVHNYPQYNIFQK